MAGRSIITGLGALFLAAAPAAAAPVTRSYALTATFTNPRYPVINGSFAFTFDNAATVATTTTGLTTATLDVPALGGGTSKLHYSLAGDDVMISNYTNPSGCYPYITTMYCLDIRNVSTATPTATFYYIDNFGTAATPQYGQVYAATAVLTPQAAGAVPEPATWAAMIAGFGALGTTLRRRTLPLARA